MIENNKFIKRIIKIGVPVSIQSLIISSLNIIDSVMVGQLGETAIASVGIGNRIYFVLMFMMFGLCGGISVYTAQYWGKREIKDTLSTFGFMLTLGSIPVIIFSIISYLFPENIAFLFSSDENVLIASSSYLKITSMSFFFTLISFAASTFFRSCEQTRLPMLISSFSVIINTTLNYILIFGKFGAPTMGIEGAAIATLFARIIESICFSVFFFIKYKFISVKYIFSFSRLSAKSMLLISLPVLFNETIWVSGDAAYAAIYGKMGTSDLAAITITYPIQQLSMGFLTGLSTAAAVILGNSIGSSKFTSDYIYNLAKNILKFSLFVSVSVAVLILSTGKFYISFFDTTPNTAANTFILLIIFSLFMFIKVLNMIIGQGVLRSGGDTKFPMYLDIVTMWMIGLPIALLSAFYFKLSIIYVYLFIGTEEIVRLIASLIRVRGKKWINNVINEEIEIN